MLRNNWEREPAEILAVHPGHKITEHIGWDIHRERRERLKELVAVGCHGSASIAQDHSLCAILADSIMPRHPGTGSGAAGACPFEAMKRPGTPAPPVPVPFDEELLAAKHSASAQKTPSWKRQQPQIPQSGKPDPAPLLLASERDPQEVHGILTAYGLTDVAQADRNLQAMAGEPHERHQLVAILPILMESIARTADPDQALNHWERFLDNVTRSTLFDYLRTSPRMLDLLSTISDAQSRHRYAPGKWSIRDVVNHLSDVERLCVFRAMWFARQFDSALPSFDQTICVGAARADDRAWEGLVEEFRAVRAATVAFLRSLPADAWERRGIASDNPFTVRALVYVAVGHVIHHTRILRERYLRA